MSSTTFFPVSPREALKALYVGKSIRDVETPAAVMDVAAAKRNCGHMLDACRSLGLEWRAHIKTHKTAELTALQVGDDASRPVKLIISTLVEGEFVLPLLKEYRSQGRTVNIVYGLPIAPGSVPRLAALGKELGPGSISVLLDNPTQIPGLASFKALSGGVVPHAFIKIDMGGRRAGVVTSSEQFTAVVDAALAAHAEGALVLSGLYSHAGHSYAGDSRVAAMKMMAAEMSAMLQGADAILSRTKTPLPPLVLSAGASPTALSVQNIISSMDGSAAVSAEPDLVAEAAALAGLFTQIRTRSHIPEIHAGVYPTLDLQQLSAHSIEKSRLSWRDIAFTVLAEVHSFYPGRGEGGRPEALVGAGGLALGRETCKAYPGMAMLTPWGREGVEMPSADVEDVSGWIVGRFAQEHGIVTWLDRGNSAHPDELQVGQKVRLWPNHSCITGSHFGWYFVVDHSRQGKEDEIVDIWVRARGW